MQPQALRLSKITISNLRSIQRETFPLSDFTALIGYNNAGKTNILMGIRWLLAHFSLDISYFDDPNHPVEAEGIFEGITEQILNRLGDEKAAEIEPFLAGTSLRVKKVQRIPGELPGNIEFWAFCPPNGKRKGKDWVRVNDQFIAAFNRMFPESIAIWDFEGNNAYTKLMHEIFKPLERKFGGELSQVIEQFTELLSSGSDRQAEEIQAFDKE
ncbi:MAG: AAA family ATPase, partial [Fibrobacter sp.]|nr:AAA family ATPase [Fibrobacter sp.]